MKFIYCADINDAFAGIYTLLRETVADLYIIAGDLINIPFYSIEQTDRYSELQQTIAALRESAGRNGLTLEDFAGEVMRDDSADGDTQAAARRYIEASEKARETMVKKYRVLENILGTKSYTPIAVHPGDRDMLLSNTSLAGRDIYFKTLRERVLTVAGCGGGFRRIPGFPERATRKGPPGNGDTEHVARFLESERPDIIVCHGRHDATGVFQSLSRYCETHGVIECRAGLPCGDRGIRFSEAGLSLCPPYFGNAATEDCGIVTGGYFYECHADGRNVSRVVLKKLVDERIIDIAEYRREDGFSETVIDERRLREQREMREIDRYEQIPELRIFRDVRNFFRIHHTKETEERIDLLQGAVDSLGDLASGVALDLVGSVNMGVASGSSDIDTVLYLHPPAGAAWDDQYAGTLLERIAEKVTPLCHIQMIDTIDLSVVEESIRSGDIDCDSTQRFALYRSFCRPVNYRVLAPIEDLLNQNIRYRQTVEENIRVYLGVFSENPTIYRSFDKYMTRVKTQGIHIPDQIVRRIEAILKRPLR